MADAVMMMKKGDNVRARQDTCAVSGYGGSTYKRKGTGGKVYEAYGDGTFRFSAYGDKYRQSHFIVITPLQAAEAAVVQIDEQLKTLNKRRSDAVAKVEALKNPPWKKGDKFKLDGGVVVYMIYFIDDKYVMYVPVKGVSTPYTKAVAAFKNVAKRV